MKLDLPAWGVHGVWAPGGRAGTAEVIPVLLPSMGVGLSDVSSSLAKMKDQGIVQKEEGMK